MLNAKTLEVTGVEAEEELGQELGPPRNCLPVWQLPHIANLFYICSSNTFANLAPSRHPAFGVLRSESCLLLLRGRAVKFVSKRKTRRKKNKINITAAQGWDSGLLAAGGTWKKYLLAFSLHKK